MEEFEAALAQLAMRDRYRLRRIRFGRRTGALILQVEGDSSDLRTWWGDYCLRHYGVLPVNAPGPAAQPGPEEQQVLAELRAVVREASRGRPVRHLPIVFPRFAAACAALYEWQPGPDADPEDLQETVNRAIAEERRRSMREFRGRLRRVTEDTDVRAMLGGLVGAVVVVLDAVRFPHVGTLRWFRKKQFDGVRTVEGVFRRMDALRTGPSGDRQRFLVEVLLADINAHYGFFRRLNRARRPVILLPDVDTVSARRIIRDALLKGYDDTFGEFRAYPVVVTTSAPGGDRPGAGDQEAVPETEVRDAVRERFRARAAALAALGQGRQGVTLPSRLLRIGVEPSTPRRADGPGRRRKVRPGAGPVTAGVTALAVLAASFLVLDQAGAFDPEGPARCGGRSLYVHGPDCVGVSDGEDVFAGAEDAKGMKRVFARIAEQNRAVTTSGETYATVALLIPMESDEPAVRQQILSEVQGAALAQARANGDDSARPPIRLVLANPGRDYASWRTVVDDLHRDEPRLRVIAGFNLSLHHTREALRYVTNTLKIPTVASLVTADDFANPQNTGEPPYPGLARVVSTSKEQAEALLAFDPELAKAETALVYDTRRNDNYNRSLHEAFTQARAAGKVKRLTGVQDMTFDSEGLEKPGITPNQFEDIAGALCQSHARVVYFAGRAFHLELFIKKLARTYCRDKKKYTVISGSDATTLEQRLDRNERDSLQGDPRAGVPAVTVRYAAPAHPAAWDVEHDRWKKSHKDSESETPPYLSEAGEAMEALKEEAAKQRDAIGGVHLEDGRTIATYDVIRTASAALARAVHTSGKQLPDTDRIRKDLNKLNANHRIQGASGWICLTNAGNPYNKALSVVELNTAKKKLTFRGVAWPEREAPRGQDQCVVPAEP
ncbi:hypothetical protein [Streptomyces sp. NPDC048172]|uniref:hypothetical protein n=1 Tax=Streptomyces sp. NPDC048172 TaxID=3365505 RepID=UPI003713F59A